VLSPAASKKIWRSRQLALGLDQLLMLLLRLRAIRPLECRDAGGRPAIDAIDVRARSPPDRR
jgi:hypothetical protein